MVGGLDEVEGVSTEVESDVGRSKGREEWAHDQYQENLKQVEVVMEKGNQWVWKNGIEGESPWSGKEKYSHEKQCLWKEKRTCGVQIIVFVTLDYRLGVPDCEL